MVFTEAEVAYLRSQRLGRLATLRADGTLQNSPTGFRLDEATGDIDITGFNLSRSQKFHNVEANGQVAFVVDDLVSVDPWTVRCLEVRGAAEALKGATPSDSHAADEVIRIYPRRIISFGLGANGDEASKRNVEPTVSG